jgi:hypothetical protein
MDIGQLHMGDARMDGYQTITWGDAHMKDGYKTIICELCTHGRLSLNHIYGDARMEDGYKSITGVGCMHGGRISDNHMWALQA